MQIDRYEYMVTDFPMLNVNCSGYGDPWRFLAKSQDMQTDKANFGCFGFLCFSKAINAPGAWLLELLESLFVCPIDHQMVNKAPGQGLLLWPKTENS